MCGSSNGTIPEGLFTRVSHLEARFDDLLDELVALRAQLSWIRREDEAGKYKVEDDAGKGFEAADAGDPQDDVGEPETDRLQQ